MRKVEIGGASAPVVTDAESRPMGANPMAAAALFDGDGWCVHVRTWMRAVSDWRSCSHSCITLLMFTLQPHPSDTALCLSALR